MESWNTRFAALEINHLRSPTIAHPMAFEPTALLNFAVKENRTAELIDPPFVSKWLTTTDMSQQEPLLKALPSSALFRDFCASLEAKLPHRWLSGKATSVCKDASTGKFRVHYKASAGEQERRVVARAVILATGPVGKWNIPAPFEPHIASRLILHTEELLARGQGTLSEEITRRCPGESARVLVIGGGISAAQAALAACRAGHEVVLRARRPLQTRAFDIDPKWLDVRHANRLRFEFLSLPMEKRREAVRQALSGGSVPAKYLRALEELGDALRVDVDEAIDASVVSIDDDGEHVLVNGQSFAMVILATGTVSAPSCSPLYQSVEAALDAQTVCGLPAVDNLLRWVPGEDLFVLGANAVLELGPGGSNLMGAMRGAKVIADELHDLMWTQSAEEKAATSARAFANPFSLLGDGDDDAASDGASSSDEEEVRPMPAEAAPKAAAAPKKALTKAEKALQKARKHRKATKGKRGMS